MMGLVDRPAVKYLVFAQGSFFVFLLIAIVTNPAVFSNNHGLSFLGEHIKSAIPFGFGILACDYFLLQAADHLSGLKGPVINLPTALRWLAVLLMLILLTPDTVDSVFDWSHVIVSSVLFVYELGLTAWLIYYQRHGKISIALFGLQFAAGLLTMFSQIHKIYYLSEGILSFQLITGVLLVWLVYRLEHKTT